MRREHIEELRKMVNRELSSYDGDELFSLDDTELFKQIVFADAGKSFALPSEILEKIDFSSLSFDGFYVEPNARLFAGLHGVKINPQKVFIKTLKQAILEGVEFIGPFDGVNIMGADFSGSKGAKINPQKIYSKNMCGVKAKDVEFIGLFDNVSIGRADFSGSKGAKINPQIIYSKNMFRVIAKDVEFIGPFDDVSIEGADFSGSKGAKVNPQKIYNKNMSHVVAKDVEFTGPFDNVTLYRADLRTTGVEIDISVVADFTDLLADKTYSSYEEGIEKVQTALKKIKTPKKDK